MKDMFLVIPLRGALVWKGQNADLMMPDFKWRVLGSIFGRQMKAWSELYVEA
jgi:hypothetical protein